MEEWRGPHAMRSWSAYGHSLLASGGGMCGDEEDSEETVMQE